MEEITKKSIKGLFTAYLSYCKVGKNINEKGIYKNKKIRRPNFPCELSEQLVQYLLITKQGLDCRWDINKGDIKIIYDDIVKRGEVKCFSSDGPISFGPTEPWDILYLVNAKEYMKSKFKIYEVQLSNVSDEWKNIIISGETRKNTNPIKTYQMYCDAGKRPRINPTRLLEQLGDNCQEIFNGTFDELLEDT